MTGTPPTDSSTSIYHVTPASNLYDISEQGVVSPDRSHRDQLETELSENATQHSIDFPVERQNCVYFYPSWEEAAWMLGPDSEYGILPLRGHQGVVHIDASKIDSKIYIGDFKLISDAIDHQYMKEPDEVMVTRSLTDALLRYAESFIEVSGVSELDTISNQYHTPEVVIEGGVDPSAIVEFIFLKRVHTRGLPAKVRPFDQLPSPHITGREI